MANTVKLASPDGAFLKVNDLQKLEEFIRQKFKISSFYPDCFEIISLVWIYC